jgi:hypothetical protein
VSFLLLWENAKKKQKIRPKQKMNGSQKMKKVCCIDGDVMVPTELTKDIPALAQACSGSAKKHVQYMFELLNFPIDEADDNIVLPNISIADLAETLKLVNAVGLSENETIETIAGSIGVVALTHFKRNKEFFSE